ncbi:MAG: putative lipoprotein [Leptospira sp.]|nr:putative lipoprotein [Leptospira sp.]
MNLSRITYLLLPFSFAITFTMCASLDTASGSLSRLAFSASDSTSALLKSISTSVSSVSDSISSGKDEAKEAAYRQDIKASVVLFTKHPKTANDLEKDLTLVAKTHGLTNWKNLKSTYIGIGQGLKLGGTSYSDFQTVLNRVAPNNQKMALLLTEGYQSLN